MSPLGEGTSGIRQESASPGPAEGVPDHKAPDDPGETSASGNAWGMERGLGVRGSGLNPAPLLTSQVTLRLLNLPALRVSHQSAPSKGG